MKSFQSFVTESSQSFPDDEHLDHSKAVHYTHPENGYKVSIIPRKPNRYLADERFTAEVQKHRQKNGMPIREGRIRITHPNGEARNAGYWMNFPENHWSGKHKGRHVNYKWDFDNSPAGHSVWEKHVPLKHRLELEAKAQAHDYDPLPKQFEFEGRHQK